MGATKKQLSKYKSSDLLIGALLFGLSLVLAWLAVSSISWRIYHDAPIMMYVAMLIDVFHRIPYREIYEMNMPGTLFIYYLIGRITNYSDLGFRLVDLSLLAVIMGSTYYWLRTISWKSAWGAAVMFGLTYLWYGSGNSLQRDYLLVVLLSCSFMIVIALPKINSTLSLLITGFLSAVAFLIKPHAIISFGLLFLWQVYQRKVEDKKENIVKAILWYGIGFMIPIAITLVYLVKNQALGSMLDIMKNYFPLYAHINGKLMTVYGADRVKYDIINYFKFRDLWPLLIPAFFGSFVTLRNDKLPKKEKSLIYFLIASTFVSSIYPALSGQFFLYHYFMFLYLICTLTSLCLPYAFRNFSWQSILPILTLVLAFSWVLFIYAGTPEDQRQYDTSMTFVDSVAEFFSSNLKPGETVQPLDWTVGALNGMMRARVPLATSFSCDYQFYHDVSEPYIQSIRLRFIAELEKSKPRYIFWFDPTKRIFVHGQDTTMDFPELNAYVGQNYNPVVSSKTYMILERKSPT